MSERITSHPLRGASQALEKLDFEIGLLPKGEIRGNLRLDIVALSGDIERLSEKETIVACRTLHDQVTAARFERASAELKQLLGKLNVAGGGMLWARQPGGKMLSAFLQGPSAWQDTIDVSFELADELYDELIRRIDAATKAKSAPKGRKGGQRSNHDDAPKGEGTLSDLAEVNAEDLDRRVRAPRPRYHSPEPTIREPGKTAREAKKRTRHLKNQAARAEINRGYEKGASPGVDKHGKGGKKGKKK